MAAFCSVKGNKASHSMEAEFEQNEDANGTMTSAEIGELIEMEETEEMDPVLWSSLGEELIEKIIARLQFKGVVQSQLLSRKWRTCYLSRNFQTEVSRVSPNWGSYFPVYVSDKELMGYDRSSLKWERLCSLPEFPEDFCRGFSGSLAWTLSLCSFAGSLIILSYYSNCTLHIFVTNPVNKSVRRLPPLDLKNDAILGQTLDRRFDEWDDVLVLPVSHDTYIILVFARSVAVNFFQVRIYHSGLNSWTQPLPGPALSSDFRRLDSGGYLAGVLYLSLSKWGDATPYTLRTCLEDMMIFYAFDLEKRVFEQIILPSQEVPDVPIHSCKLLVCGSELMLVVDQGSRDQDEEQRLESLRARTTGTNADDLSDWALWGVSSKEYLYIPKESFLIFKFDLKSLRLTEISRGPPEKLRSRTFTGLVASDKDCIYLQTESVAEGDNEFGVVMFDVRQQVWDYLPLDSQNPCFDIDNVTLTDCVFQPGLNPFVFA